MKYRNMSLRATPTAVKTVAGIALLSGAVVAFAPWASLADPLTPLPSKGVAPYVTHFIFRPLMAFEENDLGVGKAAVLEAVGTTQNLKGEAMFDKMAARCVALSVSTSLTRSTSTGSACSPIPAATRSSRLSIPAMSTSRSRN